MGRGGQWRIPSSLGSETPVVNPVASLQSELSWFACCMAIFGTEEFMNQFIFLISEECNTTAIQQRISFKVIEIEENIWILFLYMLLLGTRWRCCLGHCSTSRKVVGLILDWVIGIFYCLTSPGLAMSLGSTESLTEMSTGGILWRVKAAGA